MTRILRAAGLAVAAAAVAVTAACGSPATVPGGGAASHKPTPSPSAFPTPATALPVGPGPQAVYAVQPQPPAGACRTRVEGVYPLPDPVCTPGATNPAVTQANIHATICVRGWTVKIRPPQSVTGPEKTANAKSYGYTGSIRTSEYDHLVPLELGGDPNDPRNLWVEPNDNPAATSFGNTKDPVENAARRAVCAGTLPLAQAQADIAHDWPALGHRLGVLP